MEERTEWFVDEANKRSHIQIQKHQKPYEIWNKQRLTHESNNSNNSSSNRTEIAVKHIRKHSKKPFANRRKKKNFPSFSSAGIFDCEWDSLSFELDWLLDYSQYILRYTQYLLFFRFRSVICEENERSTKKKQHTVR